jgi:hypothetical protein
MGVRWPNTFGERRDKARMKVLDQVSKGISKRMDFDPPADNAIDHGSFSFGRTKGATMH